MLHPAVVAIALMYHKVLKRCNRRIRPSQCPVQMINNMPLHNIVLLKVAFCYKPPTLAIFVVLLDAAHDERRLEAKKDADFVTGPKRSRSIHV